MAGGVIAMICFMGVIALCMVKSIFSPIDRVTPVRRR